MKRARTQSAEAQDEAFTLPAPMLAALQLALMTCDRDAAAEQAAMLQLERIRATKPQNERRLLEVQAAVQREIEAGGYKASGPLDMSLGTVTRRKV